MHPYILTNDGVTVALRGVPYTVSSTDKGFADLMRLIRESASTDLILDQINRIATVLKKKLSLTTELTYADGAVFYKGRALSGYVVDKLVSLIDNNQDWTAVARFVENLQLNPSKRAVDSLYRFLEVGKMPLTADGCFLAYKRVRSDYKDCYSGKFDNSIGKQCVMPRNEVDENPDRTCSAGLHVCSYDYLGHFHGARIVVCKVNPADVVAIPADYNDTKMRVSRYLVIDEVTTTAATSNVLAARSDEVVQPTFRLYDMSDPDDVEQLDEFFTSEEAKRQAYLQVDAGGCDNVQVRDNENYVIYTAERQADGTIRAS